MITNENVKEAMRLWEVMENGPEHTPRLQVTIRCTCGELITYQPSAFVSVICPKCHEFWWAVSQLYNASGHVAKVEKIEKK